MGPDHSPLIRLFESLSSTGIPMIQYGCGTQTVTLNRLVGSDVLPDGDGTMAEIICGGEGAGHLALAQAEGR